MTIDAGLVPGRADVEVDVRAGTPLSEILAAVGASGAGAWCGPHRLANQHPAGSHPLRHGSRITPEPSEPTAAPLGPHLAVVAGPDAGAVLAVDASRSIGRAGADLTLSDPAMSRMHASAVASAQGIAVRDLGSSNGVVVLDALTGARMRGPLGPEHIARLGASWIAARGFAGAPQGAEGGRDGETAWPGSPGGAPGKALSAPPERGSRKVAGMAGAGVSAIALAAMTGRWYLALLALVYPIVTIAPSVWHRVTPSRASPLAVGVDPTLAGSVPGDRTVAIVGEAHDREGLARAEILARGRRPPPHPQGIDEPWLEWLPPAHDGDGVVILVDAAPSWCDRELVALSDSTPIRDRGVAQLAPMVRVSASRAEAAARRLAGSSHDSTLPAQVRWADLPALTPLPHEGRAMRVALGVANARHGASAEGTPWVLDLDAHGPHILVAGTTGSGKSALLETLVLGLAHSLGPQDLQLALLDFKGGAGLRACLDLPHVAGSVTDLDGREARRALAALGMALVERKQGLAQAGLASFQEWERVGGAPSRLLVVVDEFQEIGILHREFMPEVSRLAAQGRSLGIHVVLSTQRPGGAVTPEIRANTATTIALRVASDAESRDLIGTSDAASISPVVPGRAIVSHGGTRLTVQVAQPIATPSPAVTIPGAADDSPTVHLAQRVGELHRHAGKASRLWHPPLPDAAPPEPLHCEPGRIALGIADLPARRARGTLAWDVAAGPLVVVGPAGAARTTVLETAAAGAAAAGYHQVWLPQDARLAARTLWLTDSRDDVLLIVDDAQTALSSLARVDRGAGAEALLARAATGVALALGVGAASHHRIAATAGMRVILAGLAPADDALWSVPRELHDVAGGPLAARAWTAEGWCEARIAQSSTARGAVVADLPPDVAAGHGDVSDSAQVAVGIGGDDARAMMVAKHSRVAVVGPAGSEREAICALIARAGAGEIIAADAPVYLPPGARDGVVVAVEPTSRVAEELCRAGSAGLVDPSPRRGRVLWVEGGVGACAQLAIGTP